MMQLNEAEQALLSKGGKTAAMRAFRERAVCSAFEAKAVVDNAALPKSLQNLSTIQALVMLLERVEALEDRIT